MKIVDTFPYFNEKELLELRIKLLYDYVDKFIICDANRTHSGKPKEFSAKKTLMELNLPLEKIKVVEVDLSLYDNYTNESMDCDFGNCNWVRERAQRNEAAKYIDINDICIISDCDEIINPKYINYYASVACRNPNRILRIPMAFLHGRANLEVYANGITPITWTLPFMCLKSHLNNYTLSQIREANAFSSLNNFKIEYEDLYTVDNGIVEKAGWHFSWMGKAEDLITKYKSAVHGHDMPGSINTEEEEKAIEFIKNYNPIEDNTDVLGRKNHILKEYNIELLPKLIFDLPNVLNFLLLDLKKNYIDFEENWFNYSELYFDIVQKYPSGSRFVEVGSWKGQSAYFMCKCIKESGKNIDFFCVDTWQGSEEHKERYDLTNLYDTFLTNLKLFESYYIPIKLDSLMASKKFKDSSLDFVFIDAAHDYESVKADILAWLPKVKKNGILAGHDYYPEHPEYCGVYQAVHEIFDKKLIKQSGDCFIIELDQINNE